MLDKDYTVALSGGCGLLGQAFIKAIVESGGRVLIGDVNEPVGKELAASYE